MAYGSQSIKVAEWCEAFGHEDSKPAVLTGGQILRRQSEIPKDASSEDRNLRFCAHPKYPVDLCDVPFQKITPQYSRGAANTSMFRGEIEVGTNINL